MILFRACVHAIKLLDPDEDLDKGFSGDLLNSLEGEGLTTMRTYRHPSNSKDNEYVLLRFEINDYAKIGDIHTLLTDYKPTYCFNVVCPRVNIQCPAYNR